MSILGFILKLKMATLYGVHNRLFACGPISALEMFDKYVYTVLKVADQFTFLATFGYDTEQAGSNRTVSSLSSIKCNFSKYSISYVECSAVDKAPLNKTRINRLCSELDLFSRHPVHWHPMTLKKLAAAILT
jgi:hypothetical protein